MVDDLRPPEQSVTGPAHDFTHAAVSQFPEWDYETVAQIAELLQPSYVEDGYDEKAPKLAANILAFSRHLMDARLECCRRAVLKEYSRMEAVHYAESSFGEVLQGFGEVENIEILKKRMMSSYMNVYLYHNAEHMLTTARDCVLFGAEIARQFGFSPEQRSRFLRILLLSGFYHDAGNGRFPRDETGRDELEAVEIFLSDVKDAGNNPQLGLLLDLKDDEVVQIGAGILATVFRDRHADVELLREREYVAECVTLFEKYGYSVSVEDLSNRMRAREAIVVQNADIASSLEAGNLIKNTFTVYFENLLKSRMFAGKSFGDNRRGFIALLRGMLQKVMHGTETSLSMEAQDGNVLLNPGCEVDVFRRRNEALPKTERELMLLLAHDRGICEAMCRVIEANVQEGSCDILSAKMSDIGSLLKEKLGEEYFAPYSAFFESGSAARSLVEMSQEEVTDVFGMRTRGVIAALENGVRDERPEVRELAAAFEHLRPDTWQGRYACELLLYAGRSPHDNSLRIMNIVPGRDPLVRKDEESTHAYVLLDGPGWLEARDEGVVVNKIYPVSMAGEMAVVTGKRAADLVVAGGPLRLLYVPGNIAREISGHKELREILCTGIAVHLARGELVTSVDDVRLREFLDKVFSFNISVLDPSYPPEYQAALKKEELAGMAEERGWEVCFKEPNEKFIFLGRTPDYVYVVIEGNCLVQLPDEDESIARGPGSMLGEMSFLEKDSAATADVYAGPEGTRLICIPRELVRACSGAVELLAERRRAERRDEN